MRRFLTVIIVLIAATIAHGAYRRSAEAQVHTRNEFVMGTVLQLRAYGPRAEIAFDQIVARLNEINDRMTINEPGSETLRIKQQAGAAPVTVSPDTFYVVQAAIEYARATGGKFDPTVEPLVSLWRIGFPEARVPSQAEIEQARSLVDYRQVQLDAANKTVLLAHAGMGLDLGAIAKGYAADEAQRIFYENGVRSALLSVGGNVYAIGKKPDGTSWRIGVQDPLDSRNEFIAALDVENETLVTSGGYERFLEVDGKRYHHILDPATGYPAATDLLSVTIVTKKSIDADALSTSLFIMGRKQALEFTEGLPGVEVILIDRDRNVYATPGIRSRITITNDNYRLVPAEGN